VTAAAPAGAAAELLSSGAVRERCRRIADAVAGGDSRWWVLDRDRLDETAAEVAAITRERYPALDIPCHSRWRHFEAGGIDRRTELEALLGARSALERARARIDLAVVSVLLDAGAGPAWSYHEAATDARYGRSEGLGVASFRAFLDGAFSARPGDPLRVDAAALCALEAPRLAALFQVRDDNPLVGLEGRAALLQRLGAALGLRVDIFGDSARPGGLFDTLTQHGAGEVAVPRVLRALLEGLGPIWPAGAMQDGVALGDAWRHRHAGGEGATRGWVPFHKLSQWLAYSLLEPLEWAGVTLLDADTLTGLPEYRNGGLLIDTGVLALRDPAQAARLHAVGDELVVEWRTLTVTLLDELAPRVRALLGRPDLPLASLLEGGTWAAGRALAQRRRGGDPPLRVASDGTVF
jgi:hypothetical protein